jgi:hypothetical protein
MRTDRQLDPLWPGRVSLQKNSVNIDLILSTMRLFARVTKANRGNIITAPYLVSSDSPSSGRELTDSKPISTQAEGIGIVIVKPIRSGTEVDSVNHHEHQIESVHQRAAENWLSAIPTV